MKCDDVGDASADSSKPSDGLRAMFPRYSDEYMADALLDSRLKAPFNGESNDHVDQWDASHDDDPSSRLGPWGLSRRICWRSIRPTMSATRLSQA